MSSVWLLTKITVVERHRFGAVDEGDGAFPRRVGDAEEIHAYDYEDVLAG